LTRTKIKATPNWTVTFNIVTLVAYANTNEMIIIINVVGCNLHQRPVICAAEKLTYLFDEPIHL